MSVMRRAAGALSLVTLLATLGALPAGAVEKHVAIKGVVGGFQPPEVNIFVGDTVKWTNQDGIVHTATSGEFDSGDIQPGKTFSHRFERAGAYSYVCSKYATMRGTVSVSPAPSSPPPPPAQTQQTTSPTPTASKSPSPSPSPSESVAPSPSEVVTGTVEAAEPVEDNKDDGGLSGGAIAAIVAGVMAAGSGAGLYFIRKTPA